MRLGYIGYCIKESEDDSTVFYAYSGADWNDKSQDKAGETAFDGTFAVDKAVLLWRPSKPKKQTESLSLAHTALADDQVIILNECRNAFRRFNRVDGIDYIAQRLIYKLFEHLHETGELPERKAFIQ